MKQLIKMVRGTDHTIVIALTNDDSEEQYEMAANEMIVFTVKRCKNDDNALIERRVTGSEVNDDGLYVVSIIPSDTIDLKPDRYYYDIGFLNSSGEFTMLVESSPFVIASNISVRPELGVASEFVVLLESNADQYVTLYFRQSVSNGVLIDWGDGSEPETVEDPKVGVQHTYASTGEYTITLTPKAGVEWNPGVYGAPSHSIVGSYSGNEDSILKEVSMDGVIDPGSCSFMFCSSLENVTLARGLTAIGWSCFNHCESLASIDIPDTVHLISENAFWHCTSLTSVTIPKSVDTIHDRVFMDCTSLRSVKVESPVLGDDMFRGCTALSNVSLNDEITEIPMSAFQDCTGLYSFRVPIAVTEIESSAFRHCSSLSRVYIPKSLTKIGNYAFDGCGALVDVYYEGTQAEWGSIDIWSGNGNLTSATIHYNSYN